MVDALSDVQDTMRRSIDSAESQLEQFQRRFISLGLLRGDDLVELDFKFLGA